ncbi:hypothetical protein BSL78_18632 [Apostichopus japonicus]|uniref:Fibronectin type-III domain-containing protein n=1 Tax=Stichopus japonicus TaxID=307972 RepID=A0A2G8K910_STIJA|nr:hypothetical protein BSL78_18632 [Apostichopus japonicus]
MAQMAPPPPENVTAVAINTTAFMVTWDILSEDDSITFNMNVSSDESYDEILENVLSGITIDEKTPGDRYEVIVFSLLDGLSTSSNTTYIRLCKFISLKHLVV